MFAVVTGGKVMAMPSFHVASLGEGGLEIYLEISVRGGGPAGHGLTG